MTDAEIEQARKSLEPPLEPLYVDSKADERNRATVKLLIEEGVISWDDAWGTPDAIMDTEFPYVPDGSIVRPFITVQQAREVQKPGQSIVIAGYATIGAARKCPDSVEHQI